MAKTGWAPRGRHVRIDGRSLLDLAIAADLDAGVAVELPAAVKAALDGRPRLLEHVAALVGQQSSGDVNQAILYATTCNDGPFPWAGHADRDATCTARARDCGRGGAALCGFGSWAACGTAAECVDWPAGPAPAPTGKLPDVPVLVLAGDRDVRTPWRDGVTVTARFRQGRMLVAPGVGHMAVSSSTCVNGAVRLWLSAGVPPARCRRVPLTIEPIVPIPQSVAATPPLGAVGGLTGRTLAATIRALLEAEASWLIVYPAG